jgi:hypothetical protein
MTRLAKVWAAAYDDPGVAQPIGWDVLCDVCGKDWTDDETSGGFLFGCYAYCPDCQDKGLKTIARDKEEWRIRGYCPQGKSFADWVRGRRGPDAVIRVERAKE